MLHSFELPNSSELAFLSRRQKEKTSEHWSLRVTGVWVRIHDPDRQVKNIKRIDFYVGSLLSAVPGVTPQSCVSLGFDKYFFHFFGIPIDICLLLDLDEISISRTWVGVFFVDLDNTEASSYVQNPRTDLPEFICSSQANSSQVYFRQPGDFSRDATIYLVSGKGTRLVSDLLTCRSIHANLESQSHHQPKPKTTMSPAYPPSSLPDVLL